jgi:hypothetical protein
MHDEVGALYIYCLASAMPRKLSARMLPDSDDDSPLGQAFLFQSGGEALVVDQLIELGINLPSADRLADTSTQTIIEFSERRAGERLACRKAIEGILESATGEKDPAAVADYLSSHRTQIKEVVDNLNKSLDEIVAVAVWNAAKITVLRVSRQEWPLHSCRKRGQRSFPALGLLSVWSDARRRLEANFGRHASAHRTTTS